MPRGKITPNTEIEHLSILGEDGEVDDSLVPEVSDDRLLAFHRAMLLSRRFDERLLNLQRQGRLGTFAPVKGQEAAQIGTAAALRESDWVVPSYRETAVAVWRGTPLEGIFLFTAGYNEGGRIPDDRNELPIAVPVGTQPLHAVGLGYGMRCRGDDSVAMTYFGDGATSEGDFHEAMNFAAVFQTPVVFVCQNNQWAISVPRTRQTHSATLVQKALAYDMPGIEVDGNDVLAVHVAAKDAVERARSGGGPTFIECITYRLEVHTTADDPTRYRDEEEVEKWRERDPIPRFQKYLIARGVLTEDRIEALEEEIKREIEEAWQKAEQQIEELRDPRVIFDHIYAEMPAHLQRQREEFDRLLKTERAEAE